MKRELTKEEKYMFCDYTIERLNIEAEHSIAIFQYFQLYYYKKLDGDYPMKINHFKEVFPELHKELFITQKDNWANELSVAYDGEKICPWNNAEERIEFLNKFKEQFK